MASISEFTEAIRFQKPLKIFNQSGGYDEMFADFVTTRASAVKLDGYRKFENGYDSIIDVYEFTCFWRYNLEVNITRETRIIYDDIEFRMESWEVIDKGIKVMKFKASAIS